MNPNNERKLGYALYMKTKKTDLKWYQKFWNIITRNKERNYKYSLVNEVTKEIRIKESKGE